MQDTIERTISINAPKERIYQAIADPAQVICWFPDAIEGDYEVGASPVFSFGEHGKNQVLIVGAKPYEYFAYRWVPGGNHFLGDLNSVANTLVEFNIEEENGACTVTLKESGFTGLPAEIIEQSFAQNSGGWDYMLGRLAAYFDASLSENIPKTTCQ